MFLTGTWLFLTECADDEPTAVSMFYVPVVLWLPVQRCVVPHAVSVWSLPEPRIVAERDRRFGAVSGNGLISVARVKRTITGYCSISSSICSSTSGDTSASPTSCVATTAAITS